MLNKGQETNRPSPPPPKKNMVIFHLWFEGGGGGVGRRYVKQFFTTGFALNLDKMQKE